MLQYHKIWRFINSVSSSASMNMAFDEAIADMVRKKVSLPTLRLYSWDRPSVTLGCFQKSTDVDIAYCMSQNIPIVRRPTGGRAILHYKELTYSISMNTNNELFSKGIFDSYKEISSALGLALTKLGLRPETNVRRKNPHTGGPLCFQSTSFSELSIKNRKIAGSAQRRWTDGLLQQGSIPYEVDASMLARVFRLPDNNYRGNGLTGLCDFLPELRDEFFREAVRTSFEETFGVDLISGSMSAEETELSLRLVAEKFQSSEWNFRR